MYSECSRTGPFTAAMSGTSTSRMFMRVPIKDERAAVSVQRRFQHTTFRACQAGVVEAVAIGVEAGHGESPSCFKFADAPPSLLARLSSYADELIWIACCGPR